MTNFAPTSHEAVHILIAEDSPTQAQRLAFALERQRYQVSIASDGRQALQMARATRPTLVISDILMPEMDGYRLCEHIKSEPELLAIPVILLTSMADPQDVMRGLECGADNFIVKPFDEQYLLSRIQFVLLNHKNDDADQPEKPLAIYFHDRQRFITSSRMQILNLLLSTYEAAMQRNLELSRAKDDLRTAIGSLETTNKELARANQRLQVEIAERELAEKQLNTLNNALIEAMKIASAANLGRSAAVAN